MPVVNIGRADFNDIVLAEPSVSTAHAKLQRRDGLWVVSDLGSTNGTYVEGEPVADETPLAPGPPSGSATWPPCSSPTTTYDDAGQRPGTQVLEQVDAEPARAPGADEARPAEPRPQRRPIRASAPKQSGPPAWLVALLVLIGLVIAYMLLTHS